MNTLDGEGVTGLRVGSRQSPLAVVQAEGVIQALAQVWPDLVDNPPTYHAYKTQGDKHLESKLSEIGEKGLFVKELETALLANEIDVAVHSLKDMPSALPEGLVLCGVGLREDPRDVLISNQPGGLKDLPAGAVVGTSATRRVAMLKRLRPDLVYQTIRGNLQTRLDKLDSGGYDAIVLAAAGVHRLGLQGRIAQYFHPTEEMVPAPGQGILAVEYRAADTAVFEKLKPLLLPDVQVAMAVERLVLETLEAGCHVPLGCHCWPVNENTYQVHIMLLSPDGQQVLERQLRFNLAEPWETMARDLALDLQADSQSLFC